jgi:hypothetical protein
VAFLTYDPTGTRDERVSPLAPRLTTLNNATVGLLHNHKHNARELAEELLSLLQERYTLKDVVGPVKVSGGVWISSDEQLDALASSCDLVVVTLGD